MNAIVDMLGKEDRPTRDEKPGFLATVHSLPNAFSIEPVLRLSIVSCRARLPAKASRPMKAKAKNTPLQDMNFSRSAPRTGAAVGDIKTMDWTIAKIGSLLSLS